MDPNNNQPINPNPLQPQQPVVPQPVAPQPVEVPVAAPTAAPSAPAQPASPFFAPPTASTPTPNPVSAPPAPTPTPVIPTVLAPQAVKNGSKKGMMLLVILLVLTLGMAAYVFFAKNQLNSAQKKSSENTSVVIPTATIAPSVTPATVEQVIVDSPDADLNTIEQDLQGL